MKKKVTRITLMRICMSVLVCAVYAVPVYAADSRTGEICAGDPGFGAPTPSLEEQLAEVLTQKSLSTEQQSMAIAKIQNAIDIRDGKFQTNQNQTRASNLNVPCFKQETSYWCGPATGKQVVHFHTGTSATQTTIASAMGTTQSGGTEWTAVRDYVNDKQKKCWYISVTPATKQKMEDYILSSINGLNSPPILHLKFSGSLQNPTPWEYSTTGHYLNAHTMYETNINKPIGLTDPYIQRVKPSSFGFYTVDSIYVWNATQAHWKKHLMY